MTITDGSYMRQRYHLRVALAKVMLGDQCCRCGSVERLQFDHRDPANKSYDITRAILGDWSKVREELKKCQLLCRPCHIVKTLAEQGINRPLGRGRNNAASTYTAKILLRLPPTLKIYLERLAHIHHRSLNDEIVERLQAQVDKERQLLDHWRSPQAIQDALHTMEPDYIEIDWLPGSEGELWNMASHEWMDTLEQKQIVNDGVELDRLHWSTNHDN